MYCQKYFCLTCPFLSRARSLNIKVCVYAPTLLCVRTFSDIMCFLIRSRTLKPSLNPQDALLIGKVKVILTSGLSNVLNPVVKQFQWCLYYTVHVQIIFNLHYQRVKKRNKKKRNENKKKRWHSKNVVYVLLTHGIHTAHDVFTFVLILLLFWHEICYNQSWRM